MPRKKAPQTQYIAIDNDRDEVIRVGNREEVVEAVRVHIDSCQLDEDEIEVNLKVFELGPEKNLFVEKLLEVSF